MTGAVLAGAVALVRSEVRHRLGKTGKYQDLPFRALQARLDTLDCDPGLYDDDHLSRVRTCGFGQSLDSEIRKVAATSWVEKPTYLCELNNATVLGGEIFCGNARFLMSRTSPYRALTMPATEIDEACIPNSFQGLTYFGHWLGDDCPAYEHFDGGVPVFSLRRPAWKDSATYQAAFAQAWNEVDALHARRLSIIRELGFNRDKLTRIDILRGRLRHKYRANPGIVYLARGPSGRDRSPENEDSLIESLAAAGVRIVFPEMGGDEVVSRCLDADAIITVEGSQACHAIFALRKGGALLIIQPPERFYNPHVEWTRLLGMRYGFVVGMPRANGFHVEPDEVMRMLARLQRF